MAHVNWQDVERFQAKRLASKIKATVPQQWARGIDTLARHDPATPFWMRNNAWIARLEKFRAEHGDAAAWHMGDGEICERAKAVAEGVSTLMDLWPEPLTEAERVQLVAGSCNVLGVDMPEADTPRGIIGKGTDQHWWRKRLRTKVSRIVEQGFIQLGLVNRSQGGYCSTDAVKRRQQQIERAEAMMGRTLVRNEAGQVYALSELAKFTTSNRDIRRGELMTRIRGCEEYADAHAHLGLFFTLTLPSRFHSMLAPPKGSSAPARRNPKFDGSSPREGQIWLRKRWSRARAELDREGIGLYGFRVAEPHHDGCPHWHALFWFEDEEQARAAREIIRRHWLRADPNEPGRGHGKRRTTLEPGARKNRVNVKWMECGGAAGYVAKYVAKNVGGSYTVNHLDGDVDGNGQGELFDATTGDVPGHMRVDAWAATWGIRQFQPIGQPSVVAWREMRRVSKDQVEQARIDGDVVAWKLYGAVHKSGDIKADWCRFMEHMGGPCRKRGEWAVRVAQRVNDETNRYGETVTKKVTVGLELPSGRWLVSRRQMWSRIAEARLDPESRASMAGPWTRFNNCTARLTGKLRNAFMGRGRHEIEDWTPPPATTPADPWADDAPPWSDADLSPAFPTL